MLVVNFVDRTNVGMIQRRGGLGFTLEATKRLRALETSSGRNFRATKRPSFTSSAL